MRMWKKLPVVLLGFLMLGAGPRVGTFDLDYGRLAGPINELSEGERDAVADAIRLMKQGRHLLALSRLSALNQSNPRNSSLRILASYALLQTGNLLGAFREAEKAHETPEKNSYKCWFLAKVALLNGKTALCERELEHVRNIGDMPAEAAELEKELKEK